MPKPFNFFARPRENRGSARERGYTTRWDKARKTFLQRNPLCEMCKADGKVVPANVVDHRIAHKGNQELFWDTDNWAALCAHCHNSTKQRMEKSRAQAVGSDGWPIE